MGSFYKSHGLDSLFLQSGGPDGELSASMRYLAQRYTMPYKECKATLTDIGSEASEMFLSEANAFLMLSQPYSSI